MVSTVLHPVKITIEGFQSFESPQSLDFSSLSVASVTGKNGEGKTTIFNALTWAVFGDTRAGDVDSIVNYSSDEATVELTFRTDGDELGRIVRTRRFNKSSSLTVQLYDDETNSWSDQGDQTIVSAQAIINRMVGMSQDTFHSLVYLDQDSNGENLFVRANSSLRRSILMSLIPDEGRWAEYQRAISARSSAVRADLKADKVRLEVTQDDIESCLDDIDDLNALAEAIGSPEIIEGRIADIEEEISSIEAQDSSADSISAMRSSLASMVRRREETARMNRAVRSQINDKLSRRRSLVDKADDLDESVNTIEKEVESLRKEVESAGEDIAALKEERVKIEESMSRADKNVTDRLEKLTSARAKLDIERERRSKLTNPCMICGTEMDDATLHNVQHESDEEITLLEDSVSELSESLAKARKTQKNVGVRETRNREETSRLTSSLRKNEAQIVASVDRIKDIKERIEEMDKEIKSIPVEDLKKQLENLVDPDPEESEVEARKKIERLEDSDQSAKKIGTLDREKRGLNETLKRYLDIDSRLNREEKRLGTLREREKSLIGRIAGFQDSLDDLSILDLAASPKGAPSILIESVLGEVKSRQDESLESLAGDGKITGVSFSQVRAKKKRSGGKQETRSELDVLASFSDGSERLVETLSDGERVRVAITNLFAMIEVFNAIHPNLVTYVLMDEPFVHLDDSVIPVVMSIVHDAVDRGVVKTVVITSHQKAVIDSAHQRIDVTPTASGSPKVTVSANV